MVDSIIVQAVVGAGAFGIVFYFWVTGKIFSKATLDDKNATIAELKETNKLDRARADSAVEAATLAVKLMEAFREGAQSRSRETR